MLARLVCIHAHCGKYTPAVVAYPRTTTEKGRNSGANSLPILPVRKDSSHVSGDVTCLCPTQAPAIGQAPSKQVKGIRAEARQLPPHWRGAQDKTAAGRASEHEEANWLIESRILRKSPNQKNTKTSESYAREGVECKGTALLHWEHRYAPEHNHQQASLACAPHLKSPDSRVPIILCTEEIGEQRNDSLQSCRGGGSAAVEPCRKAKNTGHAGQGRTAEEMARRAAEKVTVAPRNARADSDNGNMRNSTKRNIGTHEHIRKRAITHARTPPNQRRLTT